MANKVDQVSRVCVCGGGGGRWRCVVQRVGGHVRGGGRGGGWAGARRCGGREGGPGEGVREGGRRLPRVCVRGGVCVVAEPVQAGGHVFACLGGRQGSTTAYV
jgi:hypothetical protein